MPVRIEYESESCGLSQQPFLLAIFIDSPFRIAVGAGSEAINEPLGSAHSDQSGADWPRVRTQCEVIWAGFLG